MVLPRCSVLFRLKIYAKREVKVGGEESKLIRGGVRSCRDEGIDVLAVAERGTSAVLLCRCGGGVMGLWRGTFDCFLVSVWWCSRCWLYLGSCRTVDQPRGCYLQSQANSTLWNMDFVLATHRGNGFNFV